MPEQDQRIPKPESIFKHIASGTPIGVMPRPDGRYTLISGGQKLVIERNGQKVDAIAAYIPPGKREFVERGNAAFLTRLEEGGVIEITLGYFPPRLAPDGSTKPQRLGPTITILNDKGEMRVFGLTSEPIAMSSVVLVGRNPNANDIGRGLVQGVQVQETGPQTDGPVCSKSHIALSMIQSVDGSPAIFIENLGNRVIVDTIHAIPQPPPPKP